ncbi:MAG: type VI secretion system Vgr family protein, partial [Pseudomonadales bacterium]|nr:type VI secretion system Vgr family protein [Pseudomonadales bacterium]
MALSKAIFTQSNRLLALNTPLGENRLIAETLEGFESIDEGGFRFELTVLSDDAHISLKSLIGQPVRLDVQTQQSRTELRPLHGHVTEMAYEASNGGLARYRLVIEPWLAFLRWRQDSFVFQDMTVFEIVESVFADYQGQGRLTPKWRWEILDRSRYPRRGITCQYQESDFAFVQRLLAEEGLFFWFKSEKDDSPALGAHTLVIADHNGAFKPNAQSAIRFHRADATEAEDTIQTWNAKRQIRTNRLVTQSWDYKTLSTREQRLSGAGAATRTLAWSDDPGGYAWENDAQGNRLIKNAIAALELRDKCFDAV